VTPPEAGAIRRLAMRRVANGRNRALSVVPGDAAQDRGVSIVRMTGLRVLIAVTTATLSLIACDGVTSPPSGFRQARTRWAERGPSNYVVVVSRSCFCGPGSTEPVIVTVTDGQIESRVYEANGDTVPAEIASAYPDVDQLFAIIEEAYDSHAAQVTVTYHADFGYPVSVFIDRAANAADDEMGYHLTSFAEPLR